MRKNNQKNLIGLTIGHLKVVSAKDDQFFNCKCECGNRTIVRYDKLINRKIKSCGCLSREKKTQVNEKEGIVTKRDNTVSLFKKEPKKFAVPEEFRLVPASKLVGMKFGQLTVLDVVFDLKAELGSFRRNRKLLCRCECGKLRIIKRWHVVSGRTKSCGRIRSKKLPAGRDSAGLSNKYHRTYVAWLHMLHENPKSVCDGWLNFGSFLKNMGDHPVGKFHVVRLDKNRNFEPGNCVWLSELTNIEFKIDNFKIIISPDKAWANFFGIRGTKYLK